MSGVVIIGDCIIDTIVAEDGSSSSFPGGAGLNLAVGVARLGLASTLISRVGADRRGFGLRRHLLEEGVDLVGTPTADFTGVAYSRRIRGEPSYSFNPSVHRRRVSMTSAATRAIAGSDVVAVNSFPFEDNDQAGSLVDALGRRARTVVIDPNPRPALVRDVARFRRGAERVFGVADMLKLSEEDVRLLYGDECLDEPTRLFSGTVGTILLTRGADGASVVMRDGFRLDMPASPGNGPVVDTMGAGDATLASVMTFMVGLGRTPTAGNWPACLKRAMDVAAATCRSHGAALRKPEDVRDHAA